MNSKTLHVVAAAILDKPVNHSNAKVFLAKRPKDKHKGGLWEFPGGKVEEGESSFVALNRELKEEIDIDIKDSTPLIDLVYEYPDKTVRLEVFVVDQFEGIAIGAEGQQVGWFTMEELENLEFPEANLKIIESLKRMLIKT